MNKQQKVILAKLMAVIVVTVIAVVAMINLKDWINRSETIRHMQAVYQNVILPFKQEQGSVPSKPYVDARRRNLPGHARVYKWQYRAQWLDFEATGDEILAYVEKNYRSSLLGSGCVVLRLDGQIEWMDKKEFEALLAKQQSPDEVEMQQ